MIQTNTIRWLVIPIVLVLTGCSDEVVIEASLSERYETAIRTQTMTPERVVLWSRSCALCHVAGEGGAPRTGDTEAWRDRVAKGDAQLMVSTLEGFNRMPPLGYCMDCDTDDFGAMIGMMAGRQQ